ncbi:2-phosphosulfolactate phosphatase [Pelosinus propionicus]|uniref:Probable 2-phosphosulfolactate phosphatase n=1 Tax=Pelosinus propionicus DSM 13327 TaxID=1123291 RepID=A0A1I4H0P6_9FIRM|nr:2-phosphosulfolactate phosphatase [Pelosinus propionicus]SFL35799.1 2-phosphosulfolactate phosphatase [Pelosinus propionicus DSM 13327]
MKIDVILLPKETAALDLSHSVCIVLDIFRATSTIVTALANGCKTITPALSTEDAETLASQMGSVLFAGERQSIKIDGYDFGNSPFEFSKEKVAGKAIVMTTTNGTIAIKAAEKAYRTFIGSFINAKAVCMQAKQYGKDLVIVCAGTDGLFSLEDTLCAGLLVQLLKTDCEVTLTDSALGAFLLYAQAKNMLVETAVQSRNGRRLYDLRRMDDVEYCLSADLFTIVPQYTEGKIVIENR